MKHAERLTPITAVTSALATLSCCLPTGLAAAAATTSLAVVVGRLRPWLLGASVILLAIGFVQVYRRKSCERRSGVTVAILWISAAIVTAVILFPQAIASALASR